MSPDIVLCPDCGAALTGTPACVSCGLQVVGPDASRLWLVDQRLAVLDGERNSLIEEHDRLLILLRGLQPRPGQAVLASPESTTPWGVPTPLAGTTTPIGAAAGYASGPVYRGPPPREWSPKRVQNTLLGLGALLLALAGIVFAAVTYRHVGVIGRALVLLALTGTAAATPAALAKRGLTASAEAVATVALVLSILDCWALRRAGLADGVDVRTYDAVASGFLAIAAGAYARVLPLRASRIAAVALAQLPVAFVLARVEASLPITAVTLTAMAAIDLLLAAKELLPRDVRTSAAAFGAINFVAALLTSIIAIDHHDRGAGAGLLALAALLAAASTRVPEPTARAVLSGSVVPLVAGAAWATVRAQLTEVQQPLVLVAVALLVLQVAWLLPRPLRDGPAFGALGVAAVAVLTQVESLLLALGGPYTWLGAPWTLTATQARTAVSVDHPWTGTVVALVVLLAAAGCVACAGLALDETAIALVPTGVLLVLSALVLPLGLATTYPVALVLLLVVATALIATGFVAKGTLGLTLLAAGCVPALLATVWSVADRQATLTVLPVVALLAAAMSLRVPGLAAAAAVLAGAELAAFGASQDLSREQVGGLLLAAPAVCVALSFVLRGTYRIALETAGAVLAGTCLLLAVEDPGWLSWTLATSGLLCLAVAIRPDRREVGLAGGLLLSASSWVRLADADVHAPEPYVAPLALVALVFGHLRRRTSPGTSSLEAYGAGLSIALVPSLLKALVDATPTRGLLLLLVCVAVVVAGARDQLRGPLVIGGTVLAVDALHLVAPYASTLPRWSLLAVAGTLLVVVGATYEQRLRDLARLRERYDVLG